MPEGVGSHDGLVLGGAHGLQDPDPLLRHRLGVLKHGEERGVGRLAAVRRGERVDQQLEVRVHRRVRISLQHLATNFKAELHRSIETELNELMIRMNWRIRTSNFSAAVAAVLGSSALPMALSTSARLSDSGVCAF